VKRRTFIAGLGAAAAWPLAARGQQPPLPVIGFLSVASASAQPEWLAAFRRGLSESGYIEGQNVSVEYRWAEDKYNRLPELADELVRRRVNVIATVTSTPAALAAKAAAKEIPIVFSVGDDPVKLGLVTSLARPAGNATGINFFAAELAEKKVGLLHELLPNVARIGVLVNPSNIGTAEPTVRDVKAAAGAMGIETVVVNARNADEIDTAFSRLASERIEALFVAPDTFFASRHVQVAILAAHYSLATMSSVRDYVDAGGLISYGADVIDAVRQEGAYVGRILHGAKPADLPVAQSTKFTLVINLRTARAMGVDIPPTLLARADEVIE
jgi:putative tryptophan/tyrosine transport system substrate-binding protein